MKHVRLAGLILAFSFILGVHEGKIALWKQGSPDPVRVFPHRADTLPPEAREALEQGVPIDSIRQLEELAEIYLS